jgi:sterol desaturase/sphingolipid hydroxylase (fatty acid hydroxylase superfamily)
MERLGTLFAALLILSAFFWLVESLFAANPRQPRLLRRRGFFTDVVYWFVTALLTRTVAQIGLGLILIAVYRDDIAGIRAMLLERDTLLGRQPLWLQAIEMFVIGDFIAYWTHRWFHGRTLWKFRLGWLFASPKFHRWHHTSEDEGLDKNFAGLFPLFDVVFGMYYMPKGRLPERFGLAREAIPETILGQLAYPFRRATSSNSRRLDVA